VFTYHAEGQGAYVPSDLAVYQLTEDPDWAACAIAGRSILGNIAPGVRELLAAGRVAPAATQQGRATAPRLAATDPLTDALLLQTLADLRAPDSIIVEEAPSSRGPMQRHLPILQSETFYTCSSGGLGYAMPAAVGVALGKRGKKVIALLGDGSAMYSIQALWSATQLNLPITFIIVNNGRYEALHHFSKRFGIAQPVGTELPGIDFVHLAQAQGCDGVRVTRAAELVPALRAALEAPRPALLEVVVT
jgi:benzoylformate decarboxylase